MTPSARISLIACLLLSAGCSHRNASPRATTFEMNDAWIRPAGDSGATTAGYAQLVNGTSASITVSHFSTSVARVVELHQTSIDSHGESHTAMRDSVVIAAGDTLAMKPGGYHLMLIGTSRPLPAGGVGRLVMQLSDGSIVSTSARVQE